MAMSVKHTQNYNRQFSNAQVAKSLNKSETALFSFGTTYIKLIHLSMK